MNALTRLIVTLLGGLVGRVAVHYFEVASCPVAPRTWVCGHWDTIATALGMALAYVVGASFKRAPPVAQQGAALQAARESVSMRAATTPAPPISDGGAGVDTPSPNNLTPNDPNDTGSEGG